MQKGFTLVELLVVMAIMVIMFGVVRPSLTASSSKTREFECESRLKQIATAMQSYTQDYERFPAKLGGVDFILQDKTLLKCPSTDASYHYISLGENVKMDQTIASCINPKRSTKKLPHRQGDGYLELTAGGHVKWIIQNKSRK